MNTTDTKQIKEAGRKEKEARRQELDDVKSLMQTKAGRRFIFRLINNICHYDTISAQNSGSLTYMCEGERNVGRIVKAEVFEVALKEYHEVEVEDVRKKIEDALEKA